MKYTKEFWVLPKPKRLKELDIRLSKNEPIFSFPQLGYLDRENNFISSNTGMSSLWDKEGFTSLSSPIYPTSHDSDWLASRLANILLTQYCYEEGINPEHIEFVLLDERVRHETKAKLSFFERLFASKNSAPSIIFTQQTIVFIRQKN